MNLPKTLKMPPKRDNKVFSENQSIRGFFFFFEFSFQICFWSLSSTSGLSQICKIRNTWTLPSPFSRNTLITRLLGVKIIIFEEKLSDKFKNKHERRVPMVLGLLAWLGYMLKP
jgi:hypothetical protein